MCVFKLCNIAGHVYTLGCIVCIQIRVLLLRLLFTHTEFSTFNILNFKVLHINTLRIIFYKSTPVEDGEFFCFLLSVRPFVKPTESKLIFFVSENFTYFHLVLFTLYQQFVSPSRFVYFHVCRNIRDVALC